MFRKYVIAVTCVLFTFVSVSPAYETNAGGFVRGTTMYDIWCASCRVSVPGARGSGMHIGYDEENDKCIVLTNFHVVEQNQNATLQFRGTGEPIDIKGQVVTRLYNASLPADFALIAVAPSDIRRVKAPYIPLAGADAFPTENSYILSSGAPKGRFVQAWKGKILGYYNGETALFEPGPVPGQSGSAIISEIDGELWVTGVLTWLIGQEGADGARGGAIPISKLYEAAKGKRTALPSGRSPIPPGAVECAAVDDENADLVLTAAFQSKVPFCLEFTQDNCQPCEAAKKDVETIRAAGYPVYQLNVSQSEDAEKRANGLRVRAFPTFVAFSAAGNEQTRCIGPGRSSQIINALIQAELEAIDETPQPPLINESAPNLAIEPEPELDFRYRPDVNETADTAFLNDSDSKWRNRLRGRGDSNGNDDEQEQEPAPKTEKKKAAPDNNAGLLAGIENRISDRVEAIVEKQGNAFFDKAATMIKKSLRRVFWYSCLMVFFATLGAAFVRRCCAFVCNCIAGLIKPLLEGALKAIQEAQKNGKK